MTVGQKRKMQFLVRDSKIDLFFENDYSVKRKPPGSPELVTHMLTKWLSTCLEFHI